MFKKRYFIFVSLGMLLIALVRGNLLAANLSGVVTNQSSGNPIFNAEICFGDQIVHTDADGDYFFPNILSPTTDLFTVRANSYIDFGEKFSINEENNFKNIVLSPTPAYSGEGLIEHIITILNPATGSAHVKSIYKHAGCNEGTIEMDIHYVFDTGVAFANLNVKSENGTDLPFQFNRIFENGLYWYKLIIESGSTCTMTVEYDIHYISICHNGDPLCYHGYIGDTYAVFENMNHVLFFGHYSQFGTTAVRFILPAGWLRTAPWEQRGEYFVDSNSNVAYASPGIGKFIASRKSFGNYEVSIGIHKDANNFAPDPQWPVTVDSVLGGVLAADSLLRFDSDLSAVIGIPPLGTNETGYYSFYMVASNYPYAFPVLTLANDVSWIEGRWLMSISDYLGEAMLYKWGVWSASVNKVNLQDRKNRYLSEVYGTQYDLPISSLETIYDSNYQNTKQIKFYLFLYFLDYKIRTLTQQKMELSDALVYWRNNIDRGFTNTQLIEKLNIFTGADFTDFFNRYFFGTERFPVELGWDFTDKTLISMPMVASEFGRTNCNHSPICSSNFDADTDSDGLDLATYISTLSE
jgi:hypothetical protein